MNSINGSSSTSKEPGVVRRLRWVGIIEGVSYLVLLLIAMPLKYIANEPIYVRYVGMAHGCLFILYVLLLLQAAIEEKWSIFRVVWLFCASLLPIGTFITDRQLARSYRASTSPSADPSA